MTDSVAKQRLVEINVGEVSLVDRPANEEKFVVTKNKDGQQVSVAKAELDAHTATYVTLDAMRDCLYELASKLRDPSKIGEAQAEVERIKIMLDSASALAQEISKSIDDFNTVLPTLIAKAKDDKDGKKPVPPWMKEKMQKLAETLKAAAEEGDDPEASVDKALVNIVNIAKGGKKQFSKERTAKLVEALNGLSGMVKDADPEAFGNWVQAFTAKATEEPKAAPAAKSDEAPAWFSTAIEGLKKDVDAKITKVAESTTEVTKRLEAVEKVEAVSKALPANGTDKPVQKADSMWKGIL